MEGSRRRTPRPIADASLADLAAAAPGIAKAWLMDLIDATPLSSADRIPVAVIASEGPPLCAALVAALGSDEELDRLVGEAASEALAGPDATLAAVLEVTGAVEAIEALRGAVWQQLISLSPRDPTLLADASDRLAHGCALLTAVALGQQVVRPRAEPPPDELARVRAVRAGEERLWAGELDRHLSQATRAGQRVALLVAEVDEAERLRSAEGDEVADGVFDRVAKAVREELRRADVMAHEGNGRIVVIVPDSGRGAATGLAGRIAVAAQGAGTVRGAPLALSIGVAVYPEDGRDGAALASVAEEAMFAARAAGVPVEESS